MQEDNKYCKKLYIIFSFIYLFALFSAPVDAFAEDTSGNEFIDFLKIMFKVVFKIAIYFCILVVGPYCFAKGLWITYAADNQQQGHSALSYIIAGIALISAPILIAMLLVMLKNSGTWGQNAYNKILEYVIP